MQKNLENADVAVVPQASASDGTALQRNNFKSVSKSIKQDKSILVEKTWWTDISNPEQIVQVNWINGLTVANNWNEACAKVLSVFGLPGERFYYRPKEDYMIFIFKSVKDATVCRILLSETMC
jgi:hypothetical protein